jgi:predicted nucleotidyltransferase component of viral defense system
MSGELTSAQRLLLDRLSDSELADEFYFSGGSALSAYYLHHRKSLDLDMFSRLRFDPKRVLRFLDSVAEGPLIPRRVHDRYEFTVPLLGERLRVEFVHYDFDPVADSGIRHGRLRVDSLRDMVANKLSAILERTEAKDFADLYFLLQREPGIDLDLAIADCQAKFGWPALRLLLQGAFLRVERLEAWPETTPPTDLSEARRYFRERARTLIDLDVD